MRCRSVDFVLLQVAASYSPAVAIPMVALGTQSETMGIIDISATAVAASISVHSSTLGDPLLHGLHGHLWATCLLFLLQHL